MALWQFNMQKRFASTQTDSGFYYWSNVYYAYAADVFEAFDVRGSIESVELTSMATACELIDPFLQTPPGGDTETFQYHITQAGLWRDVEAEGLLTMTALIRGYIGSREAWRKWFRSPFTVEDIDGVAWKDDIYDYLDGNLVAGLRLIPLTTREGDIVERLVLDRNVHPYQMRHGTRRRSKIAYS